MSLGNEYTLVEKPAIDYFKSLGYSYIDGKQLTLQSGERESFKEVILHNRMFTSLKKLNPEIGEENIYKIIRNYNDYIYIKYLYHFKTVYSFILCGILYYFFYSYNNIILYELEITILGK